MRKLLTKLGLVVALRNAKAHAVIVAETAFVVLGDRSNGFLLCLEQATCVEEVFTRMLLRLWVIVGADANIQNAFAGRDD